MTYRHFGKYYRRKCVFAEPSAKGAEAIRSFAGKYGDFIAKPIEKAGGSGIEIVHGNHPDELDTIIEKLLKKYQYGLFVEELIGQADSMKELHPSSVNTVRIPTIRVSEKETVIFHPFLRVGRGSSVVDNAGAGGIICALDAKSGTVIAARDEVGNEYPVHPETGVKLIGFVVPQLQSAVQTAKELAQVILPTVYGMGSCFNENGWIMVESNAEVNLCGSILH